MPASRAVCVFRGQSITALREALAEYPVDDTFIGVTQHGSSYTLVVCSAQGEEGRSAIRTRQQDVLTNNHIIAAQAELERNKAGFRRVLGTTLKNQDGDVVYAPRSPDQIVPPMTDLERFINEDARFAADPLVKMALIHHRFESIHPFYDGSGRCGRIINVLYLFRGPPMQPPAD